MNFGNPVALWLLTIVVLILAFGFWSWKFKRGIISLFQLDLDRARKSQIRKYIVAGTMVTLMILVLALPQISTSITRGSGKTGEIALMVDVSKSMAAQEGLNSPNRLERVRPMLLEIVEDFPEAKIALFGFTEIARSHVPFTKDHFYLKRSIQRVLEVNSAPGAGTNFGQAILDAIERFPKEGKARVIVIFSDGEAFSSKQGLDKAEDELLKRALWQASENNITIITVGVGEKAGATIPLYDEDGKFTGQYAEYLEKIYVTHLEEEILKRIADRTRGKYCSESDYRGIIAAIEANLISGGSGEQQDYQDISPWFLIPVFLLWIIFARYYLR